MYSVSEGWIIIPGWGEVDVIEDGSACFQVLRLRSVGIWGRLWSFCIALGCLIVSFCFDQDWRVTNMFSNVSFLEEWVRFWHQLLRSKGHTSTNIWNIANYKKMTLINPNSWCCKLCMGWSSLCSLCYVSTSLNQKTAGTSINRIQQVPLPTLDKTLSQSFPPAIYHFQMH